MLIKPDIHYGFTLGINDEALGSYQNPQAAADDVYLCVTGYWPWDKLSSVDQPTDLSEWDRHP